MKNHDLGKKIKKHKQKKAHGIRQQKSTHFRGRRVSGVRDRPERKRQKCGRDSQKT